MTAAKIAILDYGMCNLLNVARAFSYLEIDAEVTSDPKKALQADRMVVPGVGAFSNALREFRQAGFDDAVREHVLAGRPLLGICVGMQMLFDASEEFGEHAGLGLLPGRVRAIPTRTVDGEPQRVPHIGWDTLSVPEGGCEWSDSILRGANPASTYYFVHSFAAEPELPSDRLANCLYGGHPICAAVSRDNITATQFHPERSGEAGLSLLRQFMAQ